MKPALIFFSCLVLPLIFSDCRKGDGDPLFTLTSRKIRMAGKWKVTHYLSETTSQNHSPNITGATNRIKTEVKDGLVEITNSVEFPMGGGSTSFSSGQAELSYVFSSKGTYTQTSEYRDVFNFNSTNNPPLTQKTVMTGNWSFMRKAKHEYKNKERILLDARHKKFVSVSDAGPKQTVLVQAIDIPAGTQAEIWAIHTLKNRLMRMYSENTNNTISINAVTGTTMSTQNIQMSTGKTEVEMQQ